MFIRIPGMDRIMKIINDDALMKHHKLAKILKFIVDRLGIPQTEYFILGSYVLREEREISDLDINLNIEWFTKAFEEKPSEFGEVQPYNGQIRWFFDLTKEYNSYLEKKGLPLSDDFSVEMFKKEIGDGFPDNRFSLKALRDNNGLETDCYGHQHFTLETLLLWKQTMNRPKADRWGSPGLPGSWFPHYR